MISAEQGCVFVCVQDFPLPINPQAELVDNLPKLQLATSSIKMDVTANANKALRLRGNSEAFSVLIDITAVLLGR